MRKLILLFLVAVAGKATVIVTFASSTVSGAGGAQVDLYAQLMNTGSGNAFINGDSWTVSGFPGFVDDSPFLINAPFFVAPGGTTASFLAMVIGIPVSQNLGPYQGALTVLGGVDGNAASNIGSGSFTLDVVAPSPEPGSLWLLAAGLVALWMRGGVRRRCGPAKAKTTV